MGTSNHAVVGIAGHFDPQGRQGAWAVVLRVDGRELVLHGGLPGARPRECEHHATGQAISALRRLRAPLRAIEVTSEVKQALVQPHLRGPRAHSWAAAREWWRSVSEIAGVRVTRKPGDAYSAALRLAEITAISSVEKLKLTDVELDTPWNREHRAREVLRRAEAAERKAEREAARGERERLRKRDEVNEYAIAKGRESSPPNYRPSRSARPTAGPGTSVHVAPLVAERLTTPEFDETATLEELMRQIGGV